MLTSQALSKMSQITMEQIDPSAMVMIDAVRVPHNLPHDQKLLSVMEQMGNPYCFRSGDVPVRVRFSKDGNSLSHSLVNHFSLLKTKL